MRSTDHRFSASNEISGSVRYPIPFIPFHNQNQNIYYPAPMALHLSPSQITNGSHMSNNVLYPPIYQIGHQQLILGNNQHLVISLPCASNNNISDHIISNQSSLDSHLSSSVTSPISMIPSQNPLVINYSLSKWNELYQFYDGNCDSRPSAGQLKNGKYFTQRSAGKDIYMVFNSKSDYINNFVNYYFSDKNFSTDEKLFNLMDDCGSVALIDLMKFPRLAQIGTTVDDIVEALKFSHFVVLVNLKNESKGIRRSDGWYPSKLIDESLISVNSQWTTSSNDSSASFQKSGSDVYRNPTNPSNQNILESANTNIVHQNNIDLKSQIIDTAVAVPTNNNSLIYFNSPNNAAIHQPIFASGAPAPAAYVHGIHHNSFPNFQPVQNNSTQMLGAAGLQSHQLILNTSQHYSNPTFFQQSPQIQLRPIWQTQDLMSRNHVLYNSSSSNSNSSNNNNNNNVRHVIGAGGNNQTNQKQCQY